MSPAAIRVAGYRLAFAAALRRLGLASALEPLRLRLRLRVERRDSGASDSREDERDKCASSPADSVGDAFDADAGPGSAACATVAGTAAAGPAAASASARAFASDSRATPAQIIAAPMPHLSDKASPNSSLPTTAVIMVLVAVFTTVATSAPDLPIPFRYSIKPKEFRRSRPIKNIPRVASPQPFVTSASCWLPAVKCAQVDVANDAGAESSPKANFALADPST